MSEEWIKCSDKLPEIGIPVNCFNKEWIDEDFNVKGIREGFTYSDGTEWIMSQWIDGADYYITVEKGAPTHWQHLPEPPSED